MIKYNIITNFEVKKLQNNRAFFTSAKFIQAFSVFLRLKKARPLQADGCPCLFNYMFSYLDGLGFALFILECS